MKIGRELDRLIAEKVMGFTLKKDDCNSYWVDKDNVEPDYRCDFSTDISAAWEVVEHIRKISRFDCLSLYSPTDESEHWYAMFDRKYHGRCYESVYDGEQGDTAPHAICLAALKSIGFEP